MEAVASQLANLGSEVQAIKGEVTRLEGLLTVFEKQLGVENNQVASRVDASEAAFNQILKQWEPIPPDSLRDSDDRF